MMQTNTSRPYGSDSFSTVSNRPVWRQGFMVVWLVLVIATSVTFWLGTDHGIASHELRSFLIIAIACIKIRFIGLYFMELRESPKVLRGLFEGYCLALGLAMWSMFLFA